MRSILLCAALLAGEPAKELFPVPGWLNGAWVSSSGGDDWVEEWWTSPRGGAMLGISRTGKGNQQTFFEQMRIVREFSGLFYCARPRGQAETCFKAVSANDQEVVFENAQHDFPTRIVYRRDGQGIAAEISGPNGGRKQSWRFVRLN